MASNSEELSAIYKQISVLEIIQKVKSQGIVWSQVTPYQFRSEFILGSDYWDIYVTRMPSTTTITLDFVKNLRPFYSINSDTEPFVIELYDEANADDEYCKDKELLSDIQSAEGCGPRTFNVGIQPAGLLANSGARMRHFYIPQDSIPSGVIVSGEHESKNNIMSFVPSGGVRVSGGFDSFDNIQNISMSGGIRNVANSVATTRAIYNSLTPTAAGALLSGMSLVVNTIDVISAGVLASGRAIFTNNINVASAGAIAGGNANLIYTVDIEAAGVVAAGTIHRNADVVLDGMARHTERYTVTTTGVGLRASAPVKEITTTLHYRVEIGPGSGYSSSLGLTLQAGVQYMAVVLMACRGSETMTMEWDGTPMNMIGAANVDWTGIGFNESTAIGYLPFTPTTSSSEMHFFDLNIGSPSNDSMKALIFSIKGLTDFTWSDTGGDTDTSGSVSYSPLMRSNVGVCSGTYLADSGTGTWGNGFFSNNVFTPISGGSSYFAYGVKSINDTSADITPTVSFPATENWLNIWAAFS